MIKVQNITKIFSLGTTRVMALENVSLSIERGEFLAISGPSGSGKTTLLNMMGCLEKPSSGRVLINGADTAGMSRETLANLRAQHIGFIFQNFNLFPVMTAEENVEYPLILNHVPKSQHRQRVLSCLRVVGLEKYASHKPRELSGGQRQRVAIARALVAEPDVILADEPTANLDQETGMEIITLMKRLNTQRKTTFVFSTHDPKIISAASRVLRLVDGRLERQGTSDVVESRIPEYL